MTDETYLDATAKKLLGEADVALAAARNHLYSLSEKYIERGRYKAGRAVYLHIARIEEFLGNGEPELPEELR